VSQYHTRETPRGKESSHRMNEESRERIREYQVYNKDASQPLPNKLRSPKPKSPPTPKDDKTYLRINIVDILQRLKKIHGMLEIHYFEKTRSFLNYHGMLEESPIPLQASHFEKTKEE